MLIYQYNKSRSKNIREDERYMEMKENLLTKGQALLLIIVGVWMGTVFIFGQQYWQR